MLKRPISSVSPIVALNDTTVGFSFVLAPWGKLSQRGLHKIPPHILTLKLFKAYRRTLERAAVEIHAFLHGHKTVPVYTPAMYRYPRKKGKTEQLRNHVQARYNLAKRKLFIRWTAPHAKWVSKQSPDFNVKIKRARTPGTSLHWVKMLRPKARERLRSIWKQELAKQGLHPKSLPISTHDALVDDLACRLCAVLLDMN